MPAGQGVVVLRVEGTSSRFAAPRAALCRFSKVAASMLEGAADDEELPLGSEHSTDETVATYVAWLLAHCAPGARVSRVPTPLPRQGLSELFSTTDLAFIEMHLVPGGDMRDSTRLMMFLGLSVFLGSQVSLEIGSAYLAHKIREAADAAVAEKQHPTTPIRAWYGASGAFSASELDALSRKYQWLRSVDYGQMERESAEAHATAAAAVAPPTSSDGAATE